MTNAAERLLRPATLLRLEGAVILAAALLCYRQLGVNWLLFALLLLFPDLGALGYLGGGRLGVACYNATHLECTRYPPAPRAVERWGARHGHRDDLVRAYRYGSPGGLWPQGADTDRARRAARRHLLRPGYALRVLPGVAPPLAV